MENIVQSFRGKKISNMSREELIDAINVLAGEFEKERRFPIDPERIELQLHYRDFHHFVPIRASQISDPTGFQQSLNYALTKLQTNFMQRVS